LISGRVAPEDCSPGAPTDPYVPSRAYGSSRHELASAIRCRFVNTSTGFDAPGKFPSNGVMTWHPLLSTGSLGWFPRFNDTMGRSDSPPPVSTRFECFTNRYHRFARVLLPSVVGVPPGAWELSGPVSHPEMRWKRRGLSGSLETLVAIVRALRPRRARRREQQHMLMIHYIGSRQSRTHSDTRRSWDGDGNNVTSKDPMGRITTTVFDALDRPTVVVDPMSGHTTTTYDADGEALTVADALGRVTTNTYSVRGWLSTVTDPMGYLATITYSATGKQLGLYQQQNQQTQTQTNFYDVDDRLASETDGNGHTTSYGYDGVGNQTSVTDANTNITTMLYDSRNRATTITDALGHSTVIGYDGSGNQQTVTDSLGHTSTVLYDALDRATTMTSAISGTTTITYDAAGCETSLTDPVGNKTQWAYDANDRLTTMTLPNSATVTYVYDNDGELTDTTDADGRRTTYSYNSDGDQTGETWVGASPAEKITYAYDADNELTGANDSFATLTFTYDSGGNEITAATSGPGTGQPSVTLTSGYNAQHSLTSVTDNISGNVGRTTYVYDAGQRLATITSSYNGTAGPQIITSYAPNNQISTQSRTIGGSGTAVNTTYQYDAGDRQTTITDYVSGGSALATYVYTYDQANRVTSEKDAEGTASFTYDNSNELTGVTGSRTESYTYDLNGNRTGTGYSTTVMNEIHTSPGLITYSYDNAGNTISANSGGTFTTYTYDYHNRLTGVKQGGTVIATYTYDALDRRIGVQESGSTTWTVFNGTSPDAMPYGDFNGSGTLLTRYVSGPGMVNGAVVDELLARTSSGGTSAWYLTDKLDSVRDVVSSAGSAIDHVVYDSFGNMTTETSASNGDRFKYAGMLRDTITGQNFDNARWYSPSSGRFNSVDTLGFRAKDANLFRYVVNGPTNMVDPSGHGGGLTAPPPPNPLQYNGSLPGQGELIPNLEYTHPPLNLAGRGTFKYDFPLGGGFKFSEGPDGQSYELDMGDGQSLTVKPPKLPGDDDDDSDFGLLWDSEYNWDLMFGGDQGPPEDALTPPPGGYFGGLPGAGSGPLEYGLSPIKPPLAPISPQDGALAPGTGPSELLTRPPSDPPAHTNAPVDELTWKQWWTMTWEAIQWVVQHMGDYTPPGPY
jgi:RHS repeat-associated protein